MRTETGDAERTVMPNPASLSMGRLASPAAPKCAMSALELEGYLTGIIRCADLDPPQPMDGRLMG